MMWKIKTLLRTTNHIILSDNMFCGWCEATIFFSEGKVTHRSMCGRSHSMSPQVTMLGSENRRECPMRVVTGRATPRAPQKLINKGDTVAAGGRGWEVQLRVVGQ